MVSGIIGKTTTTVATVNTSPSKQQPSTTKTHAETQTALRGVSLMEMIQRSGTSAGEDIENGKLHKTEGASGTSGTSKVKVVTVSKILDEMQNAHSISGDGAVNDSGDQSVVQGAAIFFTECECTNNKSSNSNEQKNIVESNKKGDKGDNTLGSEQNNTLKVQLPNSPIEDVNDSTVETEKGIKVKITNTIVSPLQQKRGK